MRLAVRQGHSDADYEDAAPSAAGGIRKERSSNLELLRLLAMFCIVANHLVGQGDVLRDASGVNFLFSFFVGNAARISVNVFLIIGCYRRLQIISRQISGL